MSVKAVKDLERALLAQSDDLLPRSIIEADAAVGDDEVRKAEEAFWQLLARTSRNRRFDSRSEYRFKDIDSLYFDAVEAAAPNFVIEALNYLRLYRTLAEKIRPLIREQFEVWFGNETLAMASGDLLGTVQCVDDFNEGLLSSKLVLGKLHALADRNQAASVFDRARSLLDQHMHLFVGECGTRTYFSESAVRRNETSIGERRSSLKYETHCRSTSRQRPRFLVLMSCDQEFLRIYLPYWLSVAEYLRPHGFSYQFLITEPVDAAAELVREAKDLQRSLSKFRGYGSVDQCENVAFSSVEPPVWCKSKRTFSACARFLFARALAEETEMPVIVQDIDLQLTMDPTPWFSAVPADKICLTASAVTLSIDPWQKFRGGTFVLPPSEQAFGLVYQLEDYLLCGLEEEHSWFLDQNGLGAFYEFVMASDGGEHLLFSLDELRPLVRPSVGVEVHALWEAQHRRNTP